jgi:hypothetical protein
MTGLGDVLRDCVRQLCALHYVRIHIDIDTTIKPLLVTNKAAASDATPKTPTDVAETGGISARN